MDRSSTPERAPLTVLPGGPGTVPGTGGRVLRPAPVPEASTDDAVPAGTVVPMRAAARAGTAARYCGRSAAKAAGELWLHPDRTVHALLHGKPDSFAEHVAYVRSLAWVPPELAGWKRKALIIAGVAYHALIAIPLSAAGKTLIAVVVRPLRLALLAVFITVLLLTI